MSFYPLDAISEVSRESASINQTASFDADTSRCSVAPEGLTSLLGPALEEPVEATQNLNDTNTNNTSSQDQNDTTLDFETAMAGDVTMVQQENEDDGDNNDKDDNANDNANDNADEDDDEELASPNASVEIEAYIPSPNKKDTTNDHILLDLEGDLEAQDECVVLPEPTLIESLLYYPEETVSTTHEVPAEPDVAEPVSSPEKKPFLATNTNNDEATEEIPPATPSPVKKPHTSTSPTTTEPLSPEKDDHDDKDEARPKVIERKALCCGVSRYIVVGTILFVLAALVGIVLAVTGGGSDSAAASSAREVAPGTPGTSPTTSGTTSANPRVPSSTGATEPAVSATSQANPTGGRPASQVPPSSVVDATTRATSPQQNPTTQATPSVPFTTASPPTDPPTAAPTPTPFLPLLTDLTPLATLTDPATIQGQTLAWLVDSLHHARGVELLGDKDVEAIRQRYAVSVLDRTTNGGSARVSRMDLDTCEWTGIACVNGTVTTVNWANTSLTGYLADEIAGLTDLATLDLAENQLTGPLPDGLFACTALEYLYLHQNRLSGALSEDFANLPNLLRIYLGNNQFSGRLPQGFGSPDPLSGQNMRRLRYLSVHSNDLTGPIPEGWNLRFLYYMDLSHNRLTGTLPADWGDRPSSLNRVKLVMVDHNELSGTVPASYTSMGNGRMELFHLSDNQLTGQMPGGFDPVFFISSLEFQNNQFTSMDSTICHSLVFGTLQGEITNFHADCDICICPTFCDPGICY